MCGLCRLDRGPRRARGHVELRVTRFSASPAPARVSWPTPARQLQGAATVPFAAGERVPLLRWRPIAPPQQFDAWIRYHAPCPHRTPPCTPVPMLGQAQSSPVWPALSCRPTWWPSGARWGRPGAGLLGAGPREAPQQQRAAIEEVWVLGHVGRHVMLCRRQKLGVGSDCVVRFRVKHVIKGRLPSCVRGTRFG